MKSKAQGALFNHRPRDLLRRSRRTLRIARNFRKIKPTAGAYFPSFQR